MNYSLLRHQNRIYSSSFGTQSPIPLRSPEPPVSSQVWVSDFFDHSLCFSGSLTNLPSLKVVPEGNRPRPGAVSFAAFLADGAEADSAEADRASSAARFGACAGDGAHSIANDPSRFWTVNCGLIPFRLSRRFSNSWGLGGAQPRESSACQGMASEMVNRRRLP